MVGNGWECEQVLGVSAVGLEPVLPSSDNVMFHMQEPLVSGSTVVLLIAEFGKTQETRSRAI